MKVKFQNCSAKYLEIQIIVFLFGKPFQEKFCGHKTSNFEVEKDGVPLSKRKVSLTSLLDLSTRKLTKVLIPV